MSLYYNLSVEKERAERMKVQIEHIIPRRDALLGLVRAEGLTVGAEPAGFSEALQQVLAARQDLPPELETRRQAVRDLLRNGRYKPTGRAKPASEYLLREAQAGRFPRINGPVDVANYISLQHMLPVSLWDLDRAGSTYFRFRLGREGETYVFNTAGQQIALTDLIIGCWVDPETGTDVPIVNPVKDSLATKTDERTTRVMACVYAPASAVSAETLADICQTFAVWLGRCGAHVETAWAVVQPEQTRIL